MPRPDEERPRALLVSVQLPGVSDEQLEQDLQELERLVTTLGLDVVGRLSQRRARLRAGTVLGLGKLRELAAWTGGSGDPGPRIPSQERAAERRGDAPAPEFVIDDWEAEEAPDGDAEADEEESSGASVPTGKVDVVVLDHELTPSMQHNLERATGVEVLDRSQVIVEIFHRHAKSREARLQVEIARLNYIAPRLRE